jgi:hypothetical protein
MRTLLSVFNLLKRGCFDAEPTNYLLQVTPTISLIGLSLIAVAADFNQSHWGISIL